MGVGSHHITSRKMIHEEMRDYDVSIDESLVYKANAGDGEVDLSNAFVTESDDGSDAKYGDQKPEPMIALR